MIGRLGPRPDSLDAPFWEGLEAGEVRLQHCGECGTWIWAPQPSCPNCLTLDPGWEAVEPRGTIFSWTRTWQPFTPETKDRVPYVTVVVELPGAGGRRLVGLLTEGEPEIGAEVRGSIVTEHGVAVLRWAR